MEPGAGMEEQYRTEETGVPTGRVADSRGDVSSPRRGEPLSAPLQHQREPGGELRDQRTQQDPRKPLLHSNRWGRRNYYQRLRSRLSQDAIPVRR